MTKFPSEFSELLTPRGLRILRGEDENFCRTLCGTKNYFVNLSGVVRREQADACTRLMDENLFDSLKVEQRRIPPESITDMEENYSEALSKTMHFKTAFLQRKHARSHQAAERIGLIRMMRSESYARFAEAVTGYRLGRDYSLQVICYGHGDYAGPHNDHHPEQDDIKDGFIDFHVMFTNSAVAHQYLVYAEKGHFSKMVDINVQGGVSLYKLPFWHYTTPLWGKPGREDEARRWLLLGTFKIVD